MNTIQVYVQELAQIVQLSVHDFDHRSAYQHYKKENIYQQRDTIIANALNLPQAHLRYATAEHGKPYLVNHALQFNQSHSQHYYALALSTNVQDIGVDIESIARKIRFEALAKHAFHPEEYQNWKNSNEDAKYWFKVWTTKEAILKAHGMGIRLDLNTLNTRMPFNQNYGQIIDERLGVFAYQCFNLEHSILSVAWRSNTQPTNVIMPYIHIL